MKSFQHKVSPASWPKRRFRPLLILTFIFAIVSITSGFILLRTALERSLEFDGIDDYVDFPGLSFFDGSQKTFTLETWFLSGNDTARTIFSTGPNVSGNAFALRQNGANLLEIYTPDGSLITSTRTINDTIWHHATVVYRDSVFILYLDAIAQDSAVYNLTLTGSPLNIGRNTITGTDYWDGEIDALRIWDYDFNESDIVQYVFGDTDIVPPGLAHNFDFDEAGGTVLTDRVNGDQGNLINMAGTEWTPSSAQAPIMLNSAGTGAWGTGATWEGGFVPGPLNVVNIQGGDSVFLDTDAYLAAIALFPGAALDQRGFNFELLDYLAVTNGNFYSNPSDTIFFNGSGSFINAGFNTLPTLFFLNSSSYDLFSDMTVDGGIFIDVTGELNSNGYNITMDGSSFWEQYGNYGTSGDTVLFTGAGTSHTIFGGNFESLAMDSCTIILQDTLRVSQVFAALDSGTIDLGSNVFEIGYGWDFTLGDTIIWTTGGQLLITQYLSNFYTGNNLFGNNKVVYPTIEILEGGELNLGPSGDLALAPKEQIVLNGGSFYSEGGSGVFLGDSSIVQVYSGLFRIGDDGIMVTGDGVQVINDGGELSFGVPYSPGGEAIPPTVVGIDAGASYEIIQNSGDLSVDHTGFLDMGGGGFVLNGGNVLRPFNTSRFIDGKGSAYITVNSNALNGLGMDSVGFFAGPTKNIIKTAGSGAGAVTINKAYGDLSGPAYDSVDAGSIEWINFIGEVDYALAFDGTDDYVDFASNPDFGDSVTVETWIYLANGSGFQTIADWDVGGGAFSRIEINNNRLQFSNDDGAAQSGVVTDTYIIPNGQWVHVAVVIFGGNSVQFYVNGQPTNSGGSAAVATGSGPLILGSTGGTSNWFYGHLDEFRIWSDDLPQDSIQANQFATLSGSEANLEAYYDMATGDPVGDTILIDYTSNLYDGVLNFFDFDNLSGWVQSGAQLINQHALDFDGSDNHVDVTGGPQYNSQFTLEAWILPDTVIPAATIASWNFAGSNNARLEIEGGVLKFTADNGIPSSITSSPDSIYADQWYHVAMTKDADTIELFINGKSVNSGTLGTHPAGGTDFTLGAHEAGGPFLNFYDGVIDEVRVWDTEVNPDTLQFYALTEDISTHPNLGNLSAQYSLNDGFVGGGDNTGFVTMVDSSPNNFDGTLTAFTLSGTISNWIVSEAFENGADPGLYGNGNFISGDSTNLPYVFDGTFFGAVFEYDTITNYFDLVNEGLDTLIISNVDVSDIDYQVSIDKTVLAPHDSAIVSVTFIPSFAGAFPAVVNIDYDNKSYLFKIDGIGYPDESGPGFAIDFNGGDNYAETFDQIPFDFDNGDAFSIEAWIRMTNNTGLKTIFGKQGVTSQTEGYNFRVNNGRLEFSLISDIGPNELIQIQSTDSLELNRWYHVAATYNGSSTAAGTNLFINGVPTPTSTLFDNLTSSILNSDTAQIGAVNSGIFFAGNIDEIRVWSEERTAIQIADHVTRGVDPGDAFLNAYYRADYAQNNIILDLVNGNDAVHLGAPGTFVISRAIINNEELFETLFDRSGVWLSKTNSEFSANMTMFIDGFDSEPGDNIIFAHDNPGAGDTDLAFTELDNINYLIDRRLDRQWYMEVADSLNNGGEVVIIFDNQVYDSLKSYYLLTKVEGSGQFFPLGTSTVTTLADSIAFSVEGDTLFDKSFYTLGIADQYPGNALAFDGLDDFVTVDTLQHGESFTYEFWARFNQPSPSGHGIWSFEAGANEVYIYLDTDSTIAISAINGPTEVYKGSINVNDDVWHHIAIAREAGTFRMYVDGIEDLGGGYQVGGPGTIGAANWDGGASLGVDTAFTNYARMELDEFRVWSVARDSATIVQDYLYPVSINAQNLEVYYKFDALFGDVLTDNSEDVTVGILNSFDFNSSSGWVVSDGFAPPTVQNALDFDGSDDRVDIPNIVNYDVGTSTDFTIEAWVQGSGANPDGTGIISLANSAGLFTGIQLVTYQGHLAVEVGNGALVIGPPNEDLISTSVIDDGQWHHIAVVVSRGPQSIQIMVDGIVEASFNDAIVANDLTSGVFNLGTNNNLSLHFDGAIDEVRFWSQSLGDIDVQNHIFGGRDGTEPNLEAYFKFDQGDPGGTNTGLTQLTDESLNFNDGTLNNFLLTGISSNYVSSQIDSLGPRLRLYGEDALGIADGDTVDIGTIFDGDTAVIQLTIVNVGLDSLDVSTITLGNGDFTVVTPIADSTLYPFEMQQFEVRITPTGGPVANSSIDITSNDPNSPLASWLEALVYPTPPGPGGAISLDGTVSQYLISNDSTNGFAFSSFSIEFWANRANESGGHTVFSQGNGSPSQLLQIGFAVGSLVVFDFGSDNLTFNYGALNSDWNHWAFTFDSTSLEQKIYLNGNEIANRTASAPYQGSGLINIGRLATGGTNFNGEIDEVKVWEYAVPDSIIREHLASKITGLSPNIDSLSAYFRLDEAAGTDVYEIVDGFDFTINAGTRVTSGAFIGDKSLYSYSANFLSTAGFGEKIEVTNISDPAGGAHGYLIEQNPELDSITGYQNITNGEYWGVFAPTSTFDVEIQYDPTPAEDSLRLVRRDNNADTWIPANGLFDVDKVVDTLRAFNQVSGEFAMTLLNYPTNVSPGDALNFDGINDYVDFGPLDDVQLTAGQTMEAWISTTAASGYILGRRNDDTSTGIGANLQMDGAGHVQFVVSDGATTQTVTSTIPINDGGWYHVAGSYDPGNYLRIFINGAQNNDSTTSIVATANSDTLIWSIGSRGGTGNYFNGVIDEIRIWEVAVDPTNIQSYTYSVVDEFHPDILNLKIYQRLDDGVNSPISKGLANNFDGTLTNMDPSTDWVPSGAFAIPPFTVTNMLNAGVGSFRAILDSANIYSGVDTIKFNIPGPGPWIITLDSALDVLDSVVIDGTTQPGWNFATGEVVELFDPVTSDFGIEVINEYTEIYGLRFNGFTSGLRLNGTFNGYIIGDLGKENIFINNNIGIQGISADSGLIQYNYIGVDFDSLPGPNLTGISFVNNSNNNLIGGNSGEANIIAHNNTGVLFDGAAAIQNDVFQNSIYCNSIEGISHINGSQNGILPPAIDSADVNNVYGTGTTGDQIHVYIANDSCASDQGVFYLGSTTVIGGNWTLTGISIIEGDTITATATNVASGTSEFSTPVLFGTAPLIPTVNAQVANTLEPIIDGTFEFGTDFDVTVDGTTYVLGTDPQISTDSISNWTLDLTGFPLSGDGTYDVVANSSKPAFGAVTDTTTNELIIDTAGPEVFVDILETNDQSPELTGTVADTLATIDVNVDGSNYAATNNGDGTWTLADNTITPDLGEGVYEVTVSATDSASNVGVDTSSLELIIDLTEPNITVDFIATNDQTPGLFGTIDDNFASITINVDTFNLAANNNGDGTWTLADDVISANLAEGTYEVTATATDVAGNVGTDATNNELTIDITLPNNPVVDTLITNDQTPVITGTYDFGTDLDVTVDTITYVLGVDGQLTTDSISTWTLDLTGEPLLDEGVYDVVVNSTDSSSNTASDVQLNELIIDITVPFITVDALVTSDFSPELTGTVNDSVADIDVLVDGSNYVGTNNGDGTWTLANDSISPNLSTGIYEVAATVTDKAGNAAVDTTSNELEISAIPVANAATAINEFDFTANWDDIQDASGYALDVALDPGFSQFVAGYQDFVSAGSGEVVTGLNYGTIYYYRLRTIVSPGDTSDYSNTISLQTTISSGTIADSTALVRIYNSAGGADWNRNVNWLSDRIDAWDNVVLTSGRVTSLDLSSNNMIGYLPGFSGEEFDQIEVLWLDDNELDSLADISGLATITDLQLQNNRLDFSDFEPLASLPANFAPQDSVLEAVRPLENEGDDVELDRTAPGTANTYQWYRDGSMLAGETSPTLNLTAISFADEGEYYVEIQNTIVTGVTLVSNPVDLKVSSLERDTTALRIVYDALDGPNWTNNSNWFSSDITTWFGIGSDGSRITSISLPNNNLDGEVPPEILDIINVTSIDLSDNFSTGNSGISNMPDFSEMPNLTSLDVSGNSLQFGSIEPNVGGVTTFSYDNQAEIGTESFETFEKGTMVTLSVDVSGDSNTYQWRRNGTDVSGADSSVFEIDSIDFDNMGTYVCIINNTVATDLTLDSKEQTVLAHVDIDGTVLGIDSILLSDGTIYALKIEPTQVNFDTADVVTITNGSFFLEDLILGDYVIAAEGDTSEYLPTYYRDVFEWASADTLFLRDTIEGFGINMQAIPGPPSETGEGEVGGFLEDNLDGSARLEAGRRVRRAGVMLRRRPPDSRPDNDEGFELFAYVQTDDNGEFTFEELPDGTYRINFEYPGVPMDTSSFVEFVLGEGGSEDTYSLVATVTEDGISVVEVDLTRVFHKYFKDVSIFPNPTSGQLTLEYSRLNSDNVEMNVYDLSGNLLMKKPIIRGVNQRIEIDISAFESGIYFINFTDMELLENIATLKVIKK